MPNSILSRLWPQSATQDPVASLHALVVNHARDPVFYRDLGVPDTIEGRFEVLMMTLFALLQRLQRSGPDGERTTQELLESVFRALDDDLRELGVGDLTVPKKVHTAASAFYGRSRAYARGLAGEEVLTEAIARNFPSGQAPLNHARLGEHLCRLVEALAEQADTDLIAGRATLPPVEP